VIERSNNTAKLVYKHFPLAGNLRSKPASLATVAAMEQGKFWEMHDIVFENQGALEDADIRGYARKIGLDMAKFDASYKARKGLELIEAPARLGHARLVQGLEPLELRSRRELQTLRAETSRLGPLLVAPLQPLHLGGHAFDETIDPGVHALGGASLDGIQCVGEARDGAGHRVDVLALQQRGARQVRLHARGHLAQCRESSRVAVGDRTSRRVHRLHRLLEAVPEQRRALLLGQGEGVEARLQHGHQLAQAGGEGRGACAIGLGGLVEQLHEPLVERIDDGALAALELGEALGGLGGEELEPPGGIE